MRSTMTNGSMLNASGETASGKAPAAGSSLVRVSSLVKKFRREDGSIVPAIAQVSLEVQPSEFVVILGPSGCGKTTLLRSIAGLEKCDEGIIEVHGQRVFDAAAGLNIPPERRRVSMIFQSYALWPHMSVFDNVAYPLRSRRVPESEIAGRVHEALALVSVPELVKQFPSQMSGGQQQRVALARAIVSRDNLLLFDEPLSNVDAKVREQLRLELLEMQRKLGFAALYVTHDQNEALALANRIAVMRAGRIVQLGPPREIYDQPHSRYVARFIGTSNELPGEITSGSNNGAVKTPLGDVAAASQASACKQGDRVAIVFRPERCALSRAEPEGPNKWKATIQAALYLGSHVEHVVRIGDHDFQVWSVGAEVVAPGTEVWFSVPPQHVRVVSLEDF